MNSYHLILEVPPDMAGDPTTLDKCVCALLDRSDCAALDYRALEHDAGGSAVDQSPEPVPLVTISFNLAPVGAWPGSDRGRRGDAGNGGADHRDRLLPGTAQAFQSSLASQPYLIAAALISVYIILGILYESYILPLTILSTLPWPALVRC